MSSEGGMDGGVRREEGGQGGWNKGGRERVRKDGWKGWGRGSEKGWRWEKGGRGGQIRIWWENNGGKKIRERWMKEGDKIR